MQRYTSLGGGGAGARGKLLAFSGKFRLTYAVLYRTRVCYYRGFERKAERVLGYIIIVVPKRY